MLTVLDVTNKKFNIVFSGGYNKNEVTEFLNEIASELEKITALQISQKDTIDKLNKELLHYKKLEIVLQETLISAKQFSEQQMELAEKKYQLKLAEYELQYKVKENDLEKLTADIKLLHNYQLQIKNDIKFFLMAQIENLNQNQLFPADDRSGNKNEDAS